MKKFGILWLSIFFAGIVFAHFKQNGIEAHALSETLHFGKDAFGRDCLGLVLVGAYESFQLVLPIGMLCLIASFFTASLISFAGEKSSFALKAFLDTLSSLPGFLVALALSVFFPNSEITLLIASFFMIFPWLTRFLESHLITLKLSDHVLSAKALGSNSLDIFLRHLLPDLGRLLISVLPYLVTRLLLIETSLSFLGIGTVPEHETWGRLLYQGRDYLTEAPWILTIAGLPLCLTLFSLHLITRDDRI
jgi:peptide/nickel transport system permease protein